MLAASSTTEPGSRWFAMLSSRRQAQTQRTAWASSAAAAVNVIWGRASRVRKPEVRRPETVKRACGRTTVLMSLLVKRKTVLRW